MRSGFLQTILFSYLFTTFRVEAKGKVRPKEREFLIVALLFSVELRVIKRALVSVLFGSILIKVFGLFKIIIVNFVKILSLDLCVVLIISQCVR